MEPTHISLALVINEYIKTASIANTFFFLRKHSKLLKGDLHSLRCKCLCFDCRPQGVCPSCRSVCVVFNMYSSDMELQRNSRNKHRNVKHTKPPHRPGLTLEPKPLARDSRGVDWTQGLHTSETQHQLQRSHGAFRRFTKKSVLSFPSL